VSVVIFHVIDEAPPHTYRWALFQGCL